MIADKVNKAVEDFDAYLPELSEKIYKQLHALVQDITLDNQGNIKINVKNLNALGKVKAALKRILKDKKYQSNVQQLKDVISDIVSWQTENFSKSFDEFEQEPRVIEEYQQQAFETLQESLLKAGLEANVINKAVDIVKKNINSGASFKDLTDQLKVAMLGDDTVEPRLRSYAKQVVNDTLHGVARNYNALIADKLGLEWFEYTGGLVKHSRPWCIAMEKKRWVHISELPAICRGEIDGEKVSLQGLFPGTDKDNVINNCGGYNCEHNFNPVSASRVPTAIRRKFEPDIKPDDDEKSEARPKRKK